MKKRVFLWITILIFLIITVLIFYILHSEGDMRKKEFDENWRSCDLDEECILVEEWGVCCNEIISINSDFLEEYDEYVDYNSEFVDRKDVQCSLCLPEVAEDFDAKCIEKKCEAVKKS